MYRCYRGSEKITWHGTVCVRLSKQREDIPMENEDNVHARFAVALPQQRRTDLDNYQKTPRLHTLKYHTERSQYNILSSSHGLCIPQFPPVTFIT